MKPILAAGAAAIAIIVALTLLALRRHSDALKSCWTPITTEEDGVPPVDQLDPRLMQDVDLRVAFRGPVMEVEAA